MHAPALLCFWHMHSACVDMSRFRTWGIVGFDETYLACISGTRPSTLSKPVTHTLLTSGLHGVTSEGTSGNGEAVPHCKRAFGGVLSYRFTEHAAS